MIISVGQNIVQSNLDHPNLDYLNTQLSELQAKQKVQVKVQISGTISVCACRVECKDTMLVRMTIRSTKVAFKVV